MCRWAAGVDGIGHADASTQGPAAPLTGQIAGPNDVFTVERVGVSGYADGAFNCASPATCLQGRGDADADATVASGCVSSQLKRIHLADGGFAIDSETSSWLSSSGPDPALGAAGDVQVDDQSQPPGGDPCSTGLFVGAGATGAIAIEFNGSDAKGLTSFTPTDYGSPLVRSGYGRYIGTGSASVARCDAAVSPALVALVIRAHSPVDSLVSDANGRQVGFDASSKRVVDDIPGASYLGHGSEPQTVMIEDPTQGSYDIKAIGTGTGSYTIDAQTIDGNGNTLNTVEFHGNATPGSQDTLGLSLAPGGNLGASAADTTPPVIFCGTPDTAWHAADVTIACSASDSESGLANPADASFNLSTTVPSGTETANAATSTRQVCDKAGNGAIAGPISGIKVDKNPPATSWVSPDAAWHGTDVTIGCTATDGGSGLANPVDASFNLSTTVPAGTETANAATRSHQVCDAVGNCTTAGPITGIKVDKKPPTISATRLPAPNANGWNNTDVTVSFSATDGGSGVATVSAPVTLTGEGAGQVVTGIAVDQAGNRGDHPGHREHRQDTARGHHEVRSGKRRHRRVGQRPPVRDVTRSGGAAGHLGGEGHRATQLPHRGPRRELADGGRAGEDGAGQAEGGDRGSVLQRRPAYGSTSKNRSNASGRSTRTDHSRSPSRRWTSARAQSGSKWRQGLTPRKTKPASRSSRRMRRWSNLAWRF